MKRQTRLSQRFQSGFTLLEMLVIVFIISILFAISAPGWNAFLDQQRLTEFRERTLQAIQKAQSDAKRTNTPQMIVFDNNNNTPRVAISAFTSGLAVPTNWRPLGDSKTQDGSITLSTNRRLVAK